VLPTVRSRCQSFLFARPRLPELVTLLRRVADGEGFDVPDAALALVARAAKGSFRDAVSTLDQLAAATGGEISVQAVLQLLGAVDEETLFRICDLVIDRDTAGALTYIEELSEQGQDTGRLVTDLLEHLRHLLLVQNLGEVPETLPVTDETRERLRAQANQIGEATVLRLCDLLAVAIDDMRQGADPRLPLELALVKVTRPGADLSHESLAYRLELLERPGAHSGPVPGTVPRPSSGAVAPSAGESDTAEEGTTASNAAADEHAPTPPPLELLQLQEAWQRSVIPAVEERSIPVASTVREAHPVALEGDTLTIEFPGEAAFHRKLAEDTKNLAILRDALYDVTGRRLALTFTLGEKTGPAEAEKALGEQELVALLKETFDAREVDE
jgi:DNA polymerase-3 subunit gamma/tau